MNRKQRVTNEIGVLEALVIHHSVTPVAPSDERYYGLSTLLTVLCSICYERLWARMSSCSYEQQKGWAERFRRVMPVLANQFLAKYR
jgi:hypothetical protein